MFLGSIEIDGSNLLSTLRERSIRERGDQPSSPSTLCYRLAGCRCGRNMREHESRAQQNNKRLRHATGILTLALVGARGKCRRDVKLWFSRREIGTLEGRTEKLVPQVLFCELAVHTELAVHAWERRALSDDVGFFACELFESFADLRSRLEVFRETHIGRMVPCLAFEK